MIDMLSCAFIGAIFMFLLVLASGRAIPAAPASISGESFVVRLAASTPDAMPLLTFSYPGTTRPVVLRPDRMQRSGIRRYARFADNGPMFLVLGPTPWTDTPEMRSEETIVVIERNGTDGCWEIGVLFADTRGRLATAAETEKALEAAVIVIAGQRKFERREVSRGKILPGDRERIGALEFPTTGTWKPSCP